MKTSDLKIDNITSHGRIFAILSDNMIRSFDGGHHFLDAKSISPVALTKKILLDELKFTKDNYGIFYKKLDGTTIWLKKCKQKNKWVWDVCIGDDFGNTPHICFIKHVHRLQNICTDLNDEN